MKTDVEKAYDALAQIAQSPDYIGFFTAEQLFQVRDRLECGVGTVKTAARRHSVIKDIERAETIEDLKALMAELAKEIFS